MTNKILIIGSTGKLENYYSIIAIKIIFLLKQ